MSRFRRMMATVVAFALVLGVTGSALAAGTTVPSAVYGQAPSATKLEDKVKQQLEEDLKKNNPDATPGQIAQQVAEKVKDAVVKEVKKQLDNTGVKDVEPTNWAATSIVVVVQAGLVKPDEQGNVNADQPIDGTNGAAALAKVLNIAPKDATPEEAAQQAQQAGMPACGENCTRLDFARWMGVALGIKVESAPVPFSDASDLSIDDQLLLANLYKLGIFKGFPDGTFKPGQPLTVAQIAVLIDRVMGVQGQQ